MFHWVILLDLPMILLKKNIYLKESNDKNKTFLKDEFGIDFDVESFDFEYDPFYHGLLDMIRQKTENGTLTHDENQMFRRLMREANNVALHTLIKMKAVKE